MAVQHCIYPWHWLHLDPDGFAHPCPHGSHSIGNVCRSSVEEVWNSKEMQEVRGSILAGRVHRICETKNCPHQQANDAFSPPETAIFVDDELLRHFDEATYLEDNPDIKAAVTRMEFVSGLAHFVKFGRAEGRPYRLVERDGGALPAQSENALIALREHSQGLTRVSSLPVDVVLQISTVCNLRCVMCGHGVGTVGNPRHMPVEVIERAAPYLSIAARMIFSGMGEPLLAPSFWKVIESFGKEESTFVRANSNAYFVTPENALRILGSGLKEISFSLDAATPETYAKIRGGRFERALDGVRTMCAARLGHPRKSLEIFVNMTLMRANIEEAPAFVELAHSLGVDAVIFGQLLKFGDEPSWIAERPSWTFRYSEQMLRNHPHLAHEHVTEAKRRADSLGLKLIFLQNTHLFLGPAPLDDGSAPKAQPDPLPSRPGASRQGIATS